MGKLHEVLAVESDLESISRTNLDVLKNNFSRPELFRGYHKRYEPFEEGMQNELPDENREVTTTVKKELDKVFESIIKYVDVVAQKERTNQEARADIVIDDVVIAKDLPATFLLGLETKIKQWREVLNIIPILEAGYAWEKAESKGNDIYGLKHSDEKNRTAKTFKSKVLYEATKEHPAQLKEWEETEIIGKYITQIWSGMVSMAEKTKILQKVDILLQAVKEARQRANMTEVVVLKVGKDLVNYIFTN